MITRREEEKDRNSREISPKRRKNIRRYYTYEIVSTILFILMLYGFSRGITRYVLQRSVVEGSSMQDTLKDGDGLLIDKISYHFTELHRFDIVIFDYLHAKNTYYVKRIIGLPGERVLIQDGKVYIDGELLEEHPGREEIRNPGRANQEILLGENEFFVLGDNRNNSSDSRDPSVGNVSLDQILGRVILRIYPFAQFGKVE